MRTDWEYTTHCLTCGRQYATVFTHDYGYCSDVCEKADDDE